jgi:hypothetical protein
VRSSTVVVSLLASSYVGAADRHGIMLEIRVSDKQAVS